MNPPGALLWWPWDQGGDAAGEAHAPFRHQLREDIALRGRHTAEPLAGGGEGLDRQAAPEYAQFDRVADLRTGDLGARLAGQVGKKVEALRHVRIPVRSIS